MSRIGYKVTQPLAMYEKLEHQNRFVSGSSAKVFTLTCPKNRLLPFQIKRPKSAQNVSSVKLVTPSSGVSKELLGDVLANELSIFPLASEDAIVYYGQDDLLEALPLGTHYLEISDGVNVWYSEEFKVLDFNAGEFLAECGTVLTRFEYYATCDVANSFFRTGLKVIKQFKYIFYLDVEAAKPSYEFIEEGEEDGLKNFHPEFLGVSKRYLVQRTLPAYMVDVLTEMQLFQHDRAHVNVFDWKGYSVEAKRFSVTAEWHEPVGDFAVVDISFISENLVNVNCCDGESIDDSCLETTDTVIASIDEYSLNYNTFRWADPSTGARTNFVDGDKLFIVHQSGERTFAVFNEDSESYEYQNTDWETFDTVLDLNVEGSSIFEDYFYRSSGGNWLWSPAVLADEDLGAGLRRVRGETFRGASVNLHAITPAGDEFLGQADFDSFTGDGLTYNPPAGATGLRLQAVRLNCEVGNDRVLVYPDPLTPGVGVMELGADFEVR